MGISLIYSNVLASLVATLLSSRESNHLDLGAITQLSSMQAWRMQHVRGKSKLMAPRNEPAAATGSLPTIKTVKRGDLQ